MGAEGWPSYARGKGYVGERPELGLRELLSHTPRVEMVSLGSNGLLGQEARKLGGLQQLIFYLIDLEPVCP